MHPASKKTSVEPDFGSEEASNINLSISKVLLLPQPARMNTAPDIHTCAGTNFYRKLKVMKSQKP